MTIEQPLLAQLAERRQFILYRLVQNGTKLDKVPTDPISGHNIDGQDSAAWMTGAEAAMWAEMWNANRAAWSADVVGYGVGIALYDGCGQFALDLDKCREANGTWQAHVAAFEAMFPQAARETSVSGTGRHIFIGYRGALPAHGTRNATYRMEGYSARRFIAVTGADAAGSVSVDYTAELHAFLARYFPPHADVDSGEWRDTPVSAWRGPEDDAELIRVALRERGASAVFNGRASFADLWTANADALARSFAPQNAHDSWDRSAADQALANKLAFYTGSNHERVLRLMREHQQPACALRRDKWEREGYIRGTIRRACADQREWYKGAPQAETVQPAPLLASTVPAVPAATDGAPPLPPSEAVPVTGAAHVMTFNSRNRYEATLENLVYVLGEQQQTRIGFDTFRGRIMVAVAGTEDWRPLTDVDMIQLRETLGRVKNFAPIGQELMRHEHKFDSAIVWLDGLRWDGVPRVEQFLTSYCGAADDDYSRGVSRYIFTGLARKIRDF